MTIKKHINRAQLILENRRMFLMTQIASKTFVLESLEVEIEKLCNELEKLENVG